MDFMKNLGKAALVITVGALALCLGIVLLHFIYKTIRHKFKTGLKWREAIKDAEYWKIPDFIKWCSIDILNGKDYLRLFGVWAFTGYYGTGKTLGCVLYANQLKEKYPHRDIKIYSNIEVAGQEKRITHWKEILDLPPNSIVILDEGQSDFTSTTGSNNFPIELLRKLTQVRKRQLAIFITSPVYSRLNIMIRESVSFVIESKNLWEMDRWFFYTFFRAEEYDRYVENPEKKRKYVLFKQSYIVSNKKYGLYNTVEEVESIKDEEDAGKTKKLVKSDYNALENKIDNLRNEFHKTIESEVRMLKTIIKT